MKKLALGTVVAMGMWGSLYAQYGLQVGQMYDRVWSQAYQPANILSGEYEKFRYGGQGSFWLGNTHAPLAGIFAEDGYITEEVKDRLLGDLKAKEDISAGYNLQLAAVNFKAGSLPIGIYLDENLGAYVRFNNPNTLGLILKGNGAYAGDTVSDQGMRANLVRTRELGIGTGFALGDLNLGVRLRLKQGIRMADLASLDYSLFTESNGTQVHAAGTYDLYTTPKLGKAGMFAFQGYGAGVDLGMSYNLSETMRMDLAVTDIGFTSWETNRMNESVDVQWEGIEVASLLQDSVSQEIDEQVDSLKNLLLPDTTEGRHMLLAPMQVRAGFQMGIGENGRLGGTVVWSPLPVGARARLPLVGVTYQHQLVEGLWLGATAYGLGLDSYGFGATASYRIAVGTGGIDVLVGSDNLLGFLLPSVGRGMNTFAGVGVSF